MDSCIGWIGGKRLLRKAILERFPTDKIDRYIEVFGGAGWILFGKEKIPGQLEVYNDRDNNLVNLFRCIKYHCGEVQRELDWLLTSREQFFDWMEQVDMRGLTDIQRAARFFYMVKISFGCGRKTYATDAKTVDNAAAHLVEIKKRLKCVNIENKDFADLISVYDRHSALFYLDPPYVGTERYYTGNFTLDDHRRLKDVLDGLKGRFILSYGDDPMVWELYAKFHIERVTRPSTLAAHSENKTPFSEVIIRNF